MARHKWKEEQEMEWGTKPHICTKCGIRKMWHGGDYQAWEYTWCVDFMNYGGKIDWTIKRTWHRPECGGKKV